MRADPQWQELRAVKSKALFGFPSDFYTWDQSDPRWILGLTWLAIHSHPQLAEGPTGIDMRLEIRDFYRQLYGLDADRFEALVLPRLPVELR
jgi:hypothetical protein